MREVVLLGVGMHKFGRWPEKSVEDMAQEAILKATEDAGIEFKEIQAAYCGHVLGNIGSGLRVVSRVGMTGIPITNVEAGCSAGTRAAMVACDAIAAGRYDVCLAVGFEKMGKGLIPMDGTEPAYEDLMGFVVNPAVYALHIRRHMDRYGTTREHIAKASVVGHKNAVLNPYAHHKEAMTLEEVLKSTMICDPITLYMCSSTSDGAAACILCAKEKAGQFTGRPITISGWAGGSPMYSNETGFVLGNEDETHSRVAREAYEMAGIGPENVDVCQLHDAFASATIYEVENLGFCRKGEGGPFIWEGNTEITGKIPINTDGGLVGRGHPLGATGIAQVAEIAWQLRGEAGPRQVAGNPKVGLAHNAGLGGVSVMVFNT